MRRFKVYASESHFTPTEPSKILIDSDTLLPARKSDKNGLRSYVQGQNQTPRKRSVLDYGVMQDELGLRLESMDTDSAGIYMMFRTDLEISAGDISKYKGIKSAYEIK